MSGERVTIKTPDGEFSAYVARPAAAKAPAVVVIPGPPGDRRHCDIRYPVMAMGRIAQICSAIDLQQRG
jgi:dienelactone hydrolase